MTGHTADNSNGGIPYVYVRQKDPSSDPKDPAAGADINCWIQAVHPAEVQQPGRVYYMADSRDYRPTPNGWPPAGINDGWINGWGNKIFLGSRHDGYANVMYLDGRVTRDNQTHVPQWNMDYDSATQQVRSSQWRCSTFATDIPVAGIHTQVHIMPVLMVKGWEYFFDADGQTAR
jgi:prepilin-type processing-associated H-X9-DG protein